MPNLTFILKLDAQQKVETTIEQSTLPKNWLATELSRQAGVIENKSGLSLGFRQRLTKGEFDSYLNNTDPNNVIFDVNRFIDAVGEKLDSQLVLAGNDQYNAKAVKGFNNKYSTLPTDAKGLITFVERLNKDLQILENLQARRDANREGGEIGERLAKASTGFDELNAAEKDKRIKYFQKLGIQNTKELKAEAKSYFESGEEIKTKWEKVGEFGGNITSAVGSSLFNQGAQALTLWTATKKTKETEAGKNLAKRVRGIMQEIPAPNFDVRRKELNADPNADLFEDDVYANLLIKKEHEAKLLEYYKKTADAVKEYNDAYLKEIDRYDTENAAANPAFVGGLISLVIILTGAGPIMCLGELGGFSDLFNSDFFALSAPADAVQVDVVMQSAVDGIAPLGLAETAISNPFSQAILQAFATSSSTTVNAILLSPLILAGFVDKMKAMDDHYKNADGLNYQVWRDLTMAKRFLRESESDIKKGIVEDKLELDGDVNEINKMIEFLKTKVLDDRIQTTEALFGKGVLSVDIDSNDRGVPNSALKKLRTELINLKDTDGYKELRRSAALGEKEKPAQINVDTKVTKFESAKAAEKPKSKKITPSPDPRYPLIMSVAKYVHGMMGKKASSGAAL